MDIRFNEADIVFLILTLKIIAQLPGLMFFYVSFFLVDRFNSISKTYFDN